MTSPDPGTPEKGALKCVLSGGDGEAIQTLQSFEWDAIGNLTKAINRGEVSGLTAGSLTCTEGSIAQEATATYDSLRRMTASADPETGQNGFAYDPAGRLRAITCPESCCSR